MRQKNFKTFFVRPIQARQKKIKILVNAAYTPLQDYFLTRYARYLYMCAIRHLPAMCNSMALSNSKVYLVIRYTYYTTQTGLGATRNGNNRPGIHKHHSRGLQARPWRVAIFRHQKRNDPIHCVQVLPLYRRWKFQEIAANV